MGKVSDKWIGRTNTNNTGSFMVVEKYINAEEIWVRFDSVNDLVKTSCDQFKSGSVKNPYYKSVLGIGYLGNGSYKTKTSGKQTKIYSTWRNMMERCYNPNLHKKHPTYRECRTEDSWHNFSVFAEWYESNYYEVEEERMHLDKDILVKGNKLYSPDTCVFVPHSINVLFVTHSERRGDCPIGVYWDNHKKKYRAEININGEQTKIGDYNTKEEAFQWYKDIKESVIKIAANKHKDKIPKKLYDAMYTYNVEYTD